MKTGRERFLEALNAHRGERAEVWVRLPIRLGDMVMALPSLFAIKNHWDQLAQQYDVKLHYVMTGKRSASLFQEAKAALNIQAFVDEDVAFADSPLKIRRFWGKHVPLAFVNFSKSDRMKLAAWLSRVPIRTGISDGSNNWSYHFKTPFFKMTTEHKIHCYQPLVAWLTGGVPAGVSPHLFGQLGGESVFDTLRSLGWKEEPYVVLGVMPHPTATWRQWFPEDVPWLLLSEKIKAANMTPVIVGGIEHRDHLERLAQKCGAMSLAARTSLPELAALYYCSSGTISVDTGLAHLAAIAGSPTVVIFGIGVEKTDIPCGPHCVALRGAPAGPYAYPVENDRLWDTWDAGRSTARIPPQRVWETLKLLMEEKRLAAL